MEIENGSEYLVIMFSRNFVIVFLLTNQTIKQIF